MKEYTKQWLQFLFLWMALIGIVVIGAGFVMNWYYSIPAGYQPNHPISNIPESHNLIKISIPENSTKVANGVYHLSNGSLMGCIDSTHCEIFNMERFKRNNP
jgi:hypothetical protein